MTIWFPNKLVLGGGNNGFTDVLYVGTFIDGCFNNMYI